MKKISIAVTFMALMMCLQSCAALYTCGTGGPPVQYQTEQKKEGPRPHGK